MPRRLLRTVAAAALGGSVIALAAGLVLAGAGVVVAGGRALPASPSVTLRLPGGALLEPGEPPGVPVRATTDIAASADLVARIDGHVIARTRVDALPAGRHDLRLALVVPRTYVERPRRPGRLTVSAHVVGRQSLATDVTVGTTLRFR